MVVLGVGPILLFLVAASSGHCDAGVCAPCSVPWVPKQGDVGVQRPRLCRGRLSGVGAPRPEKNVRVAQVRSVGGRPGHAAGVSSGLSSPLPPGTVVLFLLCQAVGEWRSVFLVCPLGDLTQVPCPRLLARGLAPVALSIWSALCSGLGTSSPAPWFFWPQLLLQRT